VIRNIFCLAWLTVCAPLPGTAAEPAAPSYETQVYELARRAEPDTVAKSARAHLDELAAHELDQKNYVIDFRRWGDFLQITAQRGEKKYAGTINLSAVKEIKLVAGHAPDLGGASAASARRLHPRRVGRDVLGGGRGLRQQPGQPHDPVR
jgi:hypothetical protein